MLLGNEQQALDARVAGVGSDVSLRSGAIQCASAVAPQPRLLCGISGGTDRASKRDQPRDQSLQAAGQPGPGALEPPSPPPSPPRGLLAARLRAEVSDLFAKQLTDCSERLGHSGDRVLGRRPSPPCHPLDLTRVSGTNNLRLAAAPRWSPAGSVAPDGRPCLAKLEAFKACASD